jgi:CRP-like cAMP-binding protein
VLEGQTCTEVYELSEGQASVSVAGNEVGTVQAGELVGEMSFLTGRPCTATVTATQPCFVQIIPKEEFARLVQARPHLAIRLARVLAERVALLNERVLSGGERAAGVRRPCSTARPKRY